MLRRINLEDWMVAALLSCCLTLTISSLTALRKRPALIHPVRILQKRLKAWKFLFQGPAIIQDGYNKANGAPYEVFTPENRYVFVSSAQNIKELDSAPDAVLSLQAAAKQLLQPQYTMHSFNWFDQRGVDGVPLVRTIRSLLTNNLPQIVPDAAQTISTIFDELHDSHPAVDGAKLSPLYPMILKAVSMSNARAFFGPDLAQDKVFIAAAVDFIEETLLMAEILRLLPKRIQPMSGKIMSMRFRSHQKVHDVLILMAGTRIQERDKKRLGHTVPVHKDCIQWIMETSPRQKPWSAQRIVHELMALWFGSVHILTTTICFVVHDLCLHPEYIEPLRNEVDSHQYTDFEKTGMGLPLMDSFIKESLRFSPTESMSSRRLALKPFELSDGSRVGVGEWLCTPLRAMNRDATRYPQPDEFHGFRFVDTELLRAVSSSTFQVPRAGEPSGLTDVNTDWQTWGSGRMACPGRFYATAIMKTMLASFIKRYDIQLVDPTALRWFTWRSFQYPLASTKVILQPHSTKEA